MPQSLLTSNSDTGLQTFGTKYPFTVYGLQLTVGKNASIFI